MTQRVDDLVARLRAIAEELDDVMFGELQDAIARRSGRTPRDRQLLQARRAIERAAHLLEGAPRDDPPE